MYCTSRVGHWFAKRFTYKQSQPIVKVIQYLLDILTQFFLHKVVTIDSTVHILTLECDQCAVMTHYFEYFHACFSKLFSLVHKDGK